MLISVLIWKNSWEIFLDLVWKWWTDRLTNRHHLPQSHYTFISFVSFIVSRQQHLSLLRMDVVHLSENTIWKWVIGFLVLAFGENLGHKESTVKLPEEWIGFPSWTMGFVSGVIHAEEVVWRVGASGAHWHRSSCFVGQFFFLQHAVNNDVVV